MAGRRETPEQLRNRRTAIQVGQRRAWADPVIRQRRWRATLIGQARAYASRYPGDSGMSAALVGAVRDGRRATEGQS